MYKRVLVATDGSSLSDKAVAAAIDLALLTGAELVSVNVAHIQPYGYFEGSMLLNQTDFEANQKHVEQAAQRVADAVRDTALAKGVRRADAVVMKSNQVAEAIIHAAKNQDCDLIVMAWHGRRSLARLLLGGDAARADAFAHSGAGAALN